MSNNTYTGLTKSKEINAMKNPAFMIIIIAVFLASCTATYQSGTPYDEVYATSDRKVTRVTQEKVTISSTPVETRGAYGDEDYYSEEYEQEDFDAEGYYDYEYTSRIKRFNSEATGFDYYDGYYTDAYQYTGTTNNYGTTIYNGCGACYGGSGLSMSIGFGWGWGYSSYGWGYPYYGWGYPYYGWGYPYYGWYRPYYSYWPSYPYYGWGGYNSGYWAGYNHGYWDGYYGYGYGGGYYPSPYYDYGTTYYGPRGNRNGASDGSGLARGTGRAGYDQAGGGSSKAAPSSARQARTADYSSPSTRSAMDQTNERSASRGAGTVTGSDRPTRSVTAEGATMTREASRQGNTGSDSRQTRAVNPTQRTYEKPTATRQATTGTSGTSKREVSNVRRYEFPEQKYEKPKEYSSPKVRTTPSRNEYSSPSSRNTRGFSTNESTRKTYMRKAESKPVESRSYNRSSSNSSRSVSPSQQQPSRSYSAPARSNSRSYSAPSRSSSRSFSSPSRSSSSSGAVRSGGGSSSRSSGGSSSSSSRGGGRR